MHWLYILWFHYCWPSLLGNGPEAIIQIIIGFVLGVLFWPPLRRRIHKFFDTKNRLIHEQLEHLHTKIDKIHEHMGINK